jgi:hypothetical protein
VPQTGASRPSAPAINPDERSGLEVLRGGSSVARIPGGRRGAALIGTIAAIVLGTALLLYFVFREHFASALVGVAGLVLGAASLVVGVIPLFQHGTPPKADSTTAVNLGLVQGPQITAGGDVVVLEHDPYQYRRPEFPMTPMRRPGNNGPSTNNPDGQST